MSGVTDSIEPATARMNWPLLLLACALVLAVTVYPAFLADAQGKANHNAAMLAGWAISAGMVRGVGFVPKNKLARWLLSPAAFWLACIGMVLLPR